MRGKVLIVDDDPLALRLISYALQVEGYETVMAESGGEALTAVEGEHPSLIILDVMMPDMSGIEVCRCLRSNSQTAHLPVLMLSAKGKVEDKVTGLKAGADDYVPKPVHPAELVARVETLMIRAARTTAPGPEAQVLAFVGAKGGVGTTTVAVNVALALVQRGKSVILVDLHPYLGCVCSMLGLHPPHGLMELAQMAPPSIRPRDVERRLFPHFTGLRVLGSDQSLPSGEQGELTSSHAEVILDGLSPMADWVMFDLPVRLTPASQAVLNRCDFVALVTEPDPIALRCAKGRLALLQQCGIMGELVGVVVVNRSPSAMTMTVSELQNLLDAIIVGVVPPAPEACLHALRQGAPLLLAEPDHFAAEMLKEMAQRLG